jgi:glycosyltransferase involved in cell wall biosynthesis
MARIFSIITPSYNQGKFIGDSIESVLMQAGDFYIDYIVMDAMSRDETLDVTRRYDKLLKDNCEIKKIEGHNFYIKKNPEFHLNNCLGVSFRWQSKKDKGQADAVNKGLEYAFGDIFNYLNSDDVFEKSAFAYIADEFDRTPEVAVVYGNGLYIDAQGKVIGMYPPFFKMIELPVTCIISQPSGFTRMDVVRAVGGFNERIGNSLDYEFWLRLHNEGYSFRHIREVLSSTRLHADTKTKHNRKTIHLESFASISQYHKNVPREALAIYAREVSLLGKLGRFALQVGDKVLKAVMYAFGPICYLMIRSKVEEKRKYLFGDKRV